MTLRRTGWRAMIVLLAALLSFSACEPWGDREAQLPDTETVEAAYGEAVRAEVRGNLVEIRVTMSRELLRGGAIWARSGPYFYLFSLATRDLFAEYPDLAAIRAVAEAPDGTEVARAELHRDALSTYRWQEALTLAAWAQREGTENPRRVEQLNHWGEEYTRFSYNPEFVPR